MHRALNLLLITHLRRLGRAKITDPDVMGLLTSLLPADADLTTPAWKQVDGSGGFPRVDSVRLSWHLPGLLISTSCLVASVLQAHALQTHGPHKNCSIHRLDYVHLAV